MISIICKGRLSTTKKDNKKNKTLISWWCQKVQSTCVGYFWELAMANWLLTVQNKMTNCSWYTHNHIRGVIPFHFGHFRVKYGLLCWVVVLCSPPKRMLSAFRSDQLVKFFPSNCLVGLPRELYPQMHYNIINIIILTYVFQHNYIILPDYFMTARSPGEKNVMYLGAAILN